MTRVGVVGCGFQGRLHLECLRGLEEVDVVAVCDADAERAAAAAAEFGVAARYEDHRALLDEHEVDLLTICTMPNTHREIALAGFAAGAHVLCEKPLACSAAQGRDMLAAARSTGKLLAVGFNMRYMGSATALRRLVEAGELGRPLYARAWALASEPPWWGRHYVRALSGGGALASTAVHLLDLALWMAGSPRPLTASASMATVFPRKRAATAPGPEQAAAYDVDDLISGHVRCEGGFWLTLEGSWVWDREGWDYSFALQGERALLEFDPLRATAERDGALVDVTPAVEPDVDFPASVQRELADVVAAVREGREPLVRAEEALAVQATMDALYASARSGREVEVEL